MGTSQFEGTEILRIANLNQMEVIVEVNENDIIRVSEGDTANIEIDAWTEENFKGVVTSIANSALTSQMAVDQVTNFEVKIRILPESYDHLLDNTKPHLSPFRPGMSASVDIRTQQVNNALSVPIQAVTTRENVNKKDTMNTDDSADQNNLNAQPDQNYEPELSEYVFLYNPATGKVELTEVLSGIQDSRYIQILEGLSESDTIATGPFRAISRTLEDGSLVTIVDRNQLFTE